MRQPRLPRQAQVQGLRAPQADARSAQQVQERGPPQGGAQGAGSAGQVRNTFPNPDGCLMIFGGPEDDCTKHQHKVCIREVCAANLGFCILSIWSSCAEFLWVRRVVSYWSFTQVAFPQIRRRKP
jgi:hypothetical protein